MDYVISRNCQVIGEIHKKWLSWGDTYLLLIYNPADAPFFTALAIAVDNCLHNENNNNGVKIGI
jgi:uncharacterized protein YxjI